MTNSISLNIHKLNFINLRNFFSLKFKKKSFQLKALIKN